MKVRETRLVGAGIGGPSKEVRVIEVPKEKIPPGAEILADDTKVHDWKLEEG